MVTGHGSFQGTRHYHPQLGLDLGGYIDLLPVYITTQKTAPNGY